MQQVVEYQLFRKNVFASLFSIHYTISLSRHEQVCLSRQVTSIAGAPVGIATASLTLFFSLTTEVVKKLLKKKKKKHDKVLILAKSKLSSIETLISQALIDMEISHE